MDSEMLDVTDRDEVVDELDNFDTVIHLVGASSPDAEWDTVVQLSVHGTKNMLDAAVKNAIDRVVFASSNHAVGMYNAADPTDPESMTIDPPGRLTPTPQYGLIPTMGSARPPARD